MPDRAGDTANVVRANPLLVRLARLRVPLGFLSGVVVLWLARPTVSTVAAGGVVACVGEAIRIWAAGHLNKAREVTTSGPYRWLAHPLYSGSAVMGLGLAIACGSAAVAAVIATYLIVTMTAAVRTEEAALRRSFGDQYDRYRGRNGGEGVDPGTPSVASRRFSVRQAVANREHRAVIGLVVVMLLLLMKAAYPTVVP